MRALLVFCLSWMCVYAAETGRYKPFQFSTAKPSASAFASASASASASVTAAPSNTGRYSDSSLNNGRYVADNVGSYRRSEGQYNSASASATANALKLKPLNSVLNNFSNFGSSATASASVSSSSQPPIPIKTIIPTTTGTGSSDGQYNIVRQESDVLPNGYHYLYETENKIVAEESAELKNANTDDEIIEVRGFYEYLGPDGQTYRVDYTAGANGFVPIGTHIPK